MRKTCVCGMVLNDATVPNNVIYWTYPLSDREKLLKRFSGEYRKVNQIAIWHCEKCGRFYHWREDWKVYTYKPCEEIPVKSPEIDWESEDNLYYSYNDFEDDKLRELYRSENIILFPRIVYVNDKQDLIVVNKSGEYKYFCLESVQEMTRPD